MQIFRHGDRNIVKQYPNVNIKEKKNKINNDLRIVNVVNFVKQDPYRNETNWPEGFGQLTNVSKQYSINARELTTFFNFAISVTINCTSSFNCN